MQASHKPLIIGIAGVARSGKDTFALILMNQLIAKNKSVIKFALADALKADCDEFCKKNFGFSAFTQITEEKNLIRPFLVWYGDAQRKRTGGKYWINIVQSNLEKIDADYAIITDIRYAHYPKDEIHWVTEDWHGVVVHVSRYEIVPFPYTQRTSRGDVDVVGANEFKFVQPANDHEALNDPKIKALASYRVEWEHVKSDDLVNDTELNRHVSKFIEEMKLA
jgi:hypothetical protein